MLPEQMLGEFTPTFGSGVTVTVATAVPVHAPVVPVTVYVVVFVNAGVVVGDPAVRPLVHVYVEAPVAVKLAVWPEHIVGEFTPTVGLVVTVTVATAVPVHPLVVPVTVYVVVLFNTGVVVGDPAVRPPVHV